MVEDVRTGSHGPAPALEGRCSRLVPLSEEHVGELRRIRAQPAVRRYVHDLGAASDWPLDEPSVTRFAVLVDGDVRGLVQYAEEDDEEYRHAALDVFLDPAVHGRGVGRDAVATLARYLFDHRGHHRLVIDPAADNAAAIRCYASVGFRPVGVMRRYERDTRGGGWHDGLLMDLLAEDLQRGGSGTTELRVAHTAELRTEDLQAVRALLDGAFPSDEAYTEEDHEHALGGVHALLWEGAELIGHGSVVMRRLLHDGRALRTGYVEAVAVRGDRRRRGHGDVVMEALERVIRQGYVLGALSASGMAGAFYAARGWQLWTGTVSVVTPGGVVRAEDEEGGIYVLPVDAALAGGGDLACDWRDGDPW